MAKIIVKPKATLILNGATLENACGDQWQGIELWGNNNKAGKVIMLRASTIKDALNKVELQGSS